MPGGAVLVPAPDARDDVRAAAREPGAAGDRAVLRDHGDLEAAVPVEQGGAGARAVLGSDDEVRHPRAVRRGREVLAHGETGGVEEGRALLEALALAVVAGRAPVQGGGLEEARDVVEILVADVRVRAGDRGRGQRRQARQGCPVPAARPFGRGEELHPGGDVGARGEDEVVAGPAVPGECGALVRREQHLGLALPRKEGIEVEGEEAARGVAEPGRLGGDGQPPAVDGDARVVRHVDLQRRAGGVLPEQEELLVPEVDLPVDEVPFEAGVSSCHPEADRSDG